MSERALYVAKGSIEVGDRTFHEGQMIVLEPNAEPTVKSLTQATVMALGGEPVGQRLIWWNFVSSSQARLTWLRACAALRAEGGTRAFMAISLRSGGETNVHHAMAACRRAR